MKSAYSSKGYLYRKKYKIMFWEQEKNSILFDVYRDFK